MKKKKESFLIITADDFNLTGGTARAILRLIRAGMVTETSVFVNYGNLTYLEQLRSCVHAGAGIHLNVTAGMPVLPAGKCGTLIDSRGCFKGAEWLRNNHYSINEITAEFDAQIRKFKNMFSIVPSHLNTHHHIHEEVLIFRSVCMLGRTYGIPVRQRILNNRSINRQVRGVVSTQYAYARLEPTNHWTKKSLIQTIKTLRPGINEIVVHPGYATAALKKVSRFNAQREEELQLLLDTDVRKSIVEMNITLLTFNKLKKNSAA